MSGTKQYVEQRIQMRRLQESKDLDLRRKVAETNILAGHGRSEARVEGMRRARQEAMERRDLFTDYHFTQAEQDKARRIQIAQFEDHLAEGLARRKAEQLRVKMDKKRICDGSEELRRLKENLHMAKVNKERSQQLLEIEVRKEQDRLHDHLIAEHMENERLEHCELEHKLYFEKAKQRDRVKHINQQQIAQKEALREEAKQEHLKEKAQVEELVNKIAQEDAMEHQARDEKKTETRALLRKFMVEQKARQEAMEQAERDEHDRIEAYARDKREREQRLADEKEAAEQEKKRVHGLMVGQMMAKDRAEKEMEQLRNELHMEELEHESRKKEEVKVRKRLEDKEEMRKAYVGQMQVREEKAAVQREEEEKIREELLAKFAEDDRVEMMNAQKRRMKVQEHKRDAERLIMEKRDMYERARAQELQEEALLKEAEAYRLVVVEEERQRLIQNHAAELMDFLPKGTLETAADLDLFTKCAIDAS